MTTYRRPGGASWRKKGRGIVPTQAPFQQRKPGMFTGQQPQAAQPSILDKKLNPAQYPTLNTSPGVEKTNVGLPPLQGQVPGFDADVQKRRAEAFEAARNAREAEMKKNKVGRKADKRAQKFADNLRDTPVDPRTFKGGIPDDPTAPEGQEGRLHPLHKGEGDTRQIYRGKYSPEGHHMQQNKRRAAQIQKGINEGRIMRPQSVGLPGYTSGGNFRQPGNQWALGNVEIRTANALKAGFQPIMGQVRDGTGRMVEDIIGYEKIGDVQRRKAMKAPPGEGKKIHDDPQNNPFTQTPELPGIDNAGPDIEFTKPTDGEAPLDYEVVEPGGSSDNLDMPDFSPEPLPADEVPGGTVSAPSGGVDLVPPAFGPEEGGVNLNQDGGMVIPNLTGEADPSMDLPPRLDPESERSNAEIFGGTNRPQPPSEVTPVPQTPDFTGAAPFTGPYTDEDPGLPDMVGPAPEYEVEEEGNPFDRQEDIDRQEYEQNPSQRRNPFDIQEGMQNPYSPDYDPSGGAPAQGEVPNDMEGVGDKLREENQEEIGDTGSFQPEHQVPPGVEFNDPADRRPMLPPIGSPEEADIANPPQDLSGNFPASGVELPPIGSPEEDALVNPQVPDTGLNFPPEGQSLPNIPPPPVEGAAEMPPDLNPFPMDDLDSGGPNVPATEPTDPDSDYDVEPYQAPQTQAEGLEQGLQSQVAQLDATISQTDPSSPEYAELLRGRQMLMEQLSQGPPQPPELESPEPVRHEGQAPPERYEGQAPPERYTGPGFSGVKERLEKTIEEMRRNR